MEFSSKVLLYKKGDEIIYKKEKYGTIIGKTLKKLNDGRYKEYYLVRTGTNYSKEVCVNEKDIAFKIKRIED